MLAWEPPSLESIQALLPQYQFLELIGRGGMGAVYKALQLSLDRVVAVKVLPGELLGSLGNDFGARFRHEARTMAKLAHPLIVGVYDYGETAGGLLYFVMEHVPGADLAQVLHSEFKLEPSRVCSITSQICEALSYAHEHGVIHRDIKPANVLITTDGQVKVADFGLARLSTPGQAALTRTNVSMGTPDFVAPEVLMGDKDIDARADLYAVGVMLYHLLTGEVPRGLFQMPSVRTKGEIDRRFDAVIARAMQTDREDRYPTAAALRKDLEAIDGPVIPLVPVANAKRTPRWLLMAGIVLVIAAVVAGVVLFSSDTETRTYQAGPVNDGNKALPAPMPHRSAGPWVDGLAEWFASPPKNAAEVMIKESGGGRVVDRKAVFVRGGLERIEFKDAAIRITVSNVSSYSSIYLRMTGVPGAMKNYQAVFHRTGIVKISVNGTKPGGEELLMVQPKPDFDGRARHRLEFQAVGDVLTVSVDGKEVGTVRNNALREGQAYFTGDAGMLLEKLEYREL